MSAAPSPLLSVDEALERVLAGARPVAQTETLPLLEADGRVLAADVVSPLDVPGFDNSAMDGYAVALPEGAAPPYRLPVTQRIAAGSVGAALQPGQAARIFTGAPVPVGTTGVVMQEDCQLDGEVVTINVPVKPGQHIRRRGEDIATGTVVAAHGERLDPARLSLIASIGVPAVQVAARPRVAVMFTGDELTLPGEPLPPGGIYNSNRFALISLLKRLGCTVVDLGNVPDKRDATVAALSKAGEEVDLIVTSGGVSVGEEDHVKMAVEQLGALDLWRIAMKPGKPLAFGRVGNTPFIGLPGNPVSSFVTFGLFVRPFLLALQGAPDARRPIALPAGFAWPRPDRRREFLRARWNAETGSLELFSNQGSGVMTSVVWADGLVEVEPGTTIEPGQSVRYWPLADWR